MKRAEAGAASRPQQATSPEGRPEDSPADEPAGPGAAAFADPGYGDAVDDLPPSWAGWDPVLRVTGVLVSIVAAFVTGLLELLLSTLRAGDLTTIWRGAAIGSGGGPLLGLSIVLAAVANYGIAWFAVATTRRRWAMGPPWALWTLMMLFAAGVRTHEGDYLLAGTDWVALVAILVGSLAFAVYSYRMILGRVQRP